MTEVKRKVRERWRGGKTKGRKGRKSVEERKGRK